MVIPPPLANFAAQVAVEIVAIALVTVAIAVRKKLHEKREEYRAQKEGV